MIPTAKPRAWAVAAQFSGPEGNLLICCPYVAQTAELATASVIALVMSESKTTLPLIAVNATPLSIEWMQGAINVIREAEQIAEAEKPKVVQLVSDNPRPPLEENRGAMFAECPPPIAQFAHIDQQRLPRHDRTCLRAWGPWGRCSCGADGPGAA